MIVMVSSASVSALWLGVISALISCAQGKIVCSLLAFGGIISINVVSGRDGSQNDAKSAPKHCKGSLRIRSFLIICGYEIL